MGYAIKTIQQLRPILQGFRKSKGLTQAGMAGFLGVKQQTYAELEANPAAASVERLFKVLRVLGVELILSPAPEGNANAGEPEPLASGSSLGAPTAGLAPGRQETAQGTPPKRRTARTTDSSPQHSAKLRPTAAASKTGSRDETSAPATGKDQREDW
jgi:HTH-type transcriptional regulator/antitoxin HipB